MRALAVVAAAFAVATGAAACGGGGGGSNTSVATIPTQGGQPETQTGPVGTQKAKVAKHPDTSNSVGSGGMGY